MPTPVASRVEPTYSGLSLEYVDVQLQPEWFGGLAAKTDFVVARVGDDL